MNNKAKEYYEELASKYLFLATRYIRKYDELTKIVAETILARNPWRVLDIGQGVGNVEQMILDANDEVYINCIDSEKGMVQVARQTLRPYGKRVDVQCGDITECKAEKIYDAILSNLVIHNIPHDKKSNVLNVIYHSLRDGGIFVWGDLITFDDPDKVKAAFDARKKFAIEKGEDPESDFFKKSFYKEENLDYTLTPKQTIDLMCRVGFRNVNQIWGYDNFGVFVGEK